MKCSIPLFITLLIATSSQAQVPELDPANEVTVNNATSGCVETSIAPNPVRTLHTVKCILPGIAAEGELLVYARSGAQVRRIPVNGQTAEIGLRGLRPGTYSYRLKTKEGNTNACQLAVVR